MTDTPETADTTDIRGRYMKAAHAMQSGVTFDRDPKSLEPKHLRVGVNAAMSDHSGLVTLLIAKGLFTEAEYLTAIAAAMEREAEAYRKTIARQVGSEKVTLA